MLIRKPLLILLLLLCFTNAFAATFVVTSNADSGPGTLRDALTQAAANGTTVKDYINFNIPDQSIAGRTINLQSQLPDITGNLVIDGTTQPGTPFGVSSARIMLTMQWNGTLNIFLPIDLQAGNDQAIEFYGLFILGDLSSIYTASIGLINPGNARLIIGAPGKGNVFCGLLGVISGGLENAIIQSNFFGIEPDGKTPYRNDGDIGGTCIGTLIGGPDPADGNVIMSQFNYFNVQFAGSADARQDLTVQNNFFDTDYTGTQAFTTGGGSYISATGPCDLNVFGNVFPAGQLAIDINEQVTLNAGGNFFGTDKTQTHKLGSGGYAIYAAASYAMLGGTSAADQNVFTGYDDVFEIGETHFDVIENTFYCNKQVQLPNSFNDNYIRILSLADNEVSGEAPPAASVQLYYVDGQCSDCNPKTWFATVTADASGKWDYKGIILQSVLASSTLNSNTVGFEPSTIADDELTIVNQDCHNTGSASLKEPRTGKFVVSWINTVTGNVVATGNSADLPPGNYKVKITEGDACPVAYSNPFNINDLTTRVQGGGPVYLECGNPTATFTPFITTATGISVTNYYWFDSNGKQVSGVLSPQLTPGTYTFYVKDSNGCTSTPVTIQILPQPPPPVLDASKAVKTDADCGKDNGSITHMNIQNIPVGAVAGWYDNTGSFKSYGPDLTGVGPGTYHYMILYDPNCTPMVSPDFTIGVKNGITMDESNAKPLPSSCGIASGSVIGILVSGTPPYIYSWADASGNVVSTKLDLTGVPAGIYTLTASNTYGCSQTSQPYTVQTLPPTFYPVYPYTSNNTCPNSATGTITVMVDDLVAGFRWVDSQGGNKGIGSTASGLSAGDYSLYLTDKNGCEKFYQTYTIHNIVPVSITTGSEQVTDDQCNLKTGSITGIQVSGGIQPYTYSWADANGNTVSTSLDLTNAGAGAYTLTVTDASGCQPATAQYNVQDNDVIPSTPSVSNVQVCSSGSALVNVNNASPTAIYNLYTDAGGATPLQQSAGGRFKVDVNANSSFYISQLNGSCESGRAQVNVSVGLSALNIANTFTPNGDGINDYWTINNIENYPQAIVQVFTRDGFKVFESRGYQVPFDGTYKGQKLPAGVYYFIINLNANCSLLSGSLTIIR